jgi:hypothetical protein
MNNEEVYEELPILFNNSVLSKDQLSANKPIPDPRINKNVLDFLNKKFRDILMDMDYSFTIYAAKDINNPTRDIGQATIKTVNNGNGSYSEFNIDLNNIIGNGFNLIVPTNFNGYNSDVFVNIDKHPDIVRKILTSIYNFANTDPTTEMELKAVCMDMMYPEIYCFFDFSGMFVHMDKLSEADKVTFANNLMNIMGRFRDANIPMNRFRFREFINVNNFTIVSDKETRVQLDWMVPVFAKNPKQYVNIGNRKDVNEIQIIYVNGNFNTTVNKGPMVI